MLNQLPSELVCEIFSSLPTPADYFALSISCRRLHSLGSSSHCRECFIRAYFGPERQRPAFRTICSLIASSGVRPVDRSFSATAPGIGSQAFCEFYKIAHDKAPLLDLITANCERGKWTVPALQMDSRQDILLSARATARQLTQDGPRRIFVDVEMQGRERYRCVFHLIDTIVAFDSQGMIRKGRILYRDENVLDTTDWCAIFDADQTAELAPAPQGSSGSNQKIHYSSSPRPAPKLGRRITPELWEPCRLRSYATCRLKIKIDKGNLSPGDHVDRINMYEHGEGDMICLEFMNNIRKQRGFLLLSEDSVIWEAA